MEMDEAFCNGRWYKLIPAEEAFRVRLDVQLYLRHNSELNEDSVRYVPLPKLFMRLSHNLRSNWWQGPLYIEVDDPAKAEYEPV